MHCRLLYLVGQLGAGGLERQLYYLMLALNRRKHRPAVVVWNYDYRDPYANQLHSLGVPLYPLGSGGRHRKLLQLRRLVNTLKPEILHSYSFYTNFAAWWCTRHSETIPLGSVRGTFLADRREAGRLLGCLSARWPADQICNSWSAKIAAEEFPTPFKPSRLFLVTNKLDISRFKPIGYLPNKPMLLTIGRLSSEKRWDRVLELLALLRDREIACSVRHVGDGPLRHTLEIQAKRLAVSHLIEFLGVRDDVPKLMADSTFLLHTSDEEGCPNVIMEAMACGRAVLATDAGDVPRLVQNGKTGFIVPRGDVRMLVDRAITLIEDKALCLRMGQTGRQRAEIEFGLDTLVDQTLQAYCTAGWKG